MGLIALRMPDELEQRVRVEIARRSCSISELVRDAVRAELDDPRLEPARGAVVPDAPARAPKGADAPAPEARRAVPQRRVCVHRVPIGSFCRRCGKRVA